MERAERKQNKLKVDTRNLEDGFGSRLPVSICINNFPSHILNHSGTSLSYITTTADPKLSYCSEREQLANDFKVQLVLQNDL